MPKELYLYSPIYDFVAESLISQIEDNMGNEVVIRTCTPGGSVFANYGICAKMQEHGNVTIKVDGVASSSGVNLLLYANRVECLDDSTFTVHRADMIVQSDEDKAFLAKVNKQLRAKFTKRVKPEIFKEVTGYTIDEMFDAEKRIDITLDAKQAEKIGLVQKINKLTPAEVEAMNRHALAAINEPIKTNNNMTLSELKEKHPAIYAEAVNVGVEKEKARVEAWLVYKDVDAKGVSEGIESGKDITPKAMSEFSLKAVSATHLKSIQAASAAEANGGEQPVPQSEEEKKKQESLTAFAESVKTHLKTINVN